MCLRLNLILDTSGHKRKFGRGASSIDDLSDSTATELLSSIRVAIIFGASVANLIMVAAWFSAKPAKSGAI